MTDTLRITAHGLGFASAGTTILRDVNVDVTARTIAVIGANGSGKSTFARLLAGLTAPSDGTLVVDGIDASRDTRALRRASGLLFSNPDVQIIMPTVSEDVAFTLSGRGTPKREIPARVTAALERVGLAEHHDASAHTLSGGQKQLLAVASVLVADPGFLIADEPTAYLDGANARRIARLLFADEAPPLVLVTHDLTLAARCELALHFDGGTLVGAGPAPTRVAAYAAMLDEIDARERQDG